MWGDDVSLGAEGTIGEAMSVRVLMFGGWLWSVLIAGIVCLTAGLCVAEQTAAESASAKPMERSFWLHASLGLFTQRNYFGAEFPATPMPTREQVINAARLLATTYAANRLYLIYHRELPIADAQMLFRWWRDACGKNVELVPAFVLKMYDKAQSPAFSEEELIELSSFCRGELKMRVAAIYDIAPLREAGELTKVLAKKFDGGLVRFGLQPAEPLDAPFIRGVADTWSAFCHGKRNAEDWRQPGFGAETLRKWVMARNTGTRPVAWDLVVVAWDYSATQRGGYPGYDDAEKNMPLPSGRNREAMKLIRVTAKPSLLAGFSSDLYILHENSRSSAHDGREGSFYECLKRGEDYRGYYRAPFQEVVKLFRELRDKRE